MTTEDDQPRKQNQWEHPCWHASLLQNPKPTVNVTSNSHRALCVCLDGFVEDTFKVGNEGKGVAVTVWVRAKTNVHFVFVTRLVGESRKTDSWKIFIRSLHEQLESGGSFYHSEANDRDNENTLITLLFHDPHPYDQSRYSLMLLRVYIVLIE